MANTNIIKCAIIGILLILINTTASAQKRFQNREAYAPLTVGLVPIAYSNSAFGYGLSASYKAHSMLWLDANLYLGTYAKFRDVPSNPKRVDAMATFNFFAKKKGEKVGIITGRKETSNNKGGTTVTTTYYMTDGSSLKYWGVRGGIVSNINPALKLDNQHVELFYTGNNFIVKDTFAQSSFVSKFNQNNFALGIAQNKFVSAEGKDGDNLESFRRTLYFDVLFALSNNFTNNSIDTTYFTKDNTNLNNVSGYDYYTTPSPFNKIGWRVGWEANLKLTKHINTSIHIELGKRPVPGNQWFFVYTQALPLFGFYAPSLQKAKEY
jgi:hypothetical protein